MFVINVVTPPASEPMTVAEAKEYLRVDNTVEDAVIGTMIGAATRALEDYLGIKFIDQTLDIFMDRFPVQNNSIWFDGTKEMAISELVTPLRNISLPIGNVTDVIWFKTFSDDTEFVEDLSNYVIDKVSKRCRIGLKLSGYWSTTVLRSNNAINFRVKSGWANAASIPPDIRQAVREYVSHMYETRGDQNEMMIPPHIMTLIDHRRRVKIGKN